jgi:phytoene synthase
MATFDLQPQHLMAIIDGMEMDLNQSRYLDFNGLKLLLACGRCGRGVIRQYFRDQQSANQRVCRKLGLALQMTNIIRDVGEDARKGRIYLPVNELQQFQVKAADILNAQAYTGIHATDAIPV